MGREEREREWEETHMHWQRYTGRREKNGMSGRETERRNALVKCFLDVSNTKAQRSNRNKPL